MASSVTSTLSAAAPATFSAGSQFSQDLQNVIARAVAMASLPMQQLQNEQSDVQAKIAAAQSLQTSVQSFQTAIQSLSTLSSNTLSTSVSNSAAVQVTSSSTALPGTYTVDVTDAGSYSTGMSANGTGTVTDPTEQSISTSSSLTLTVGSSTYTIQPASNSLNALAAAINSSGAGVQATIINIGGPFSPDYRLALQSTSLGNVPMQLNDGSSDLMT